MEDYTSLFSASNVPMLTDFIWVVVGVGVLVGFLVVFLSMYTAVLERTREIGSLESAGRIAGLHSQHPACGRPSCSPSPAPFSASCFLT